VIKPCPVRTSYPVEWKGDLTINLEECQGRVCWLNENCFPRIYVEGFMKTTKNYFGIVILRSGVRLWISRKVLAATVVYWLVISSYESML
jgi:hypothetical protein